MDFAAQLKSSVDIANIIGEYVKLRKAGPGRFLGLCPFHTEKTPSFHVRTAQQHFKCFGCSKGGDVFTFLMEVEGLTFFEALKALSERTGIPMPRRAEYSDRETKLKASLYELHEIAARMFRNHLQSPAGAAAREYLARRGVSAAMAEEFGLGLADAGGTALLRRFEQDGVAREITIESGLISERDGRYYDRFRNRLMFPIQNESGKVIAFGGRALSDQDNPKYLNSPETPLYRKSYVLYNLHRAKEGIRKNDRSILVEGYMDVIGVYAAGIKEVVASCGTALTATQIQALRRHSDKIVVNFDPDAAGSSAAERSIQMLLAEHMQVRVLQLAGGMDPDEYIKANGADDYKSKVAHAGSYFHWLADRVRAKHGDRSAAERVAGFKDILPAVQLVPDRIERAAIATELADYLKVDRALVLEQFRRTGSSSKPARPAAPSIPAMEKILLNCVLASRQARDEILPELRKMGGTESFQTKRVFEVLCALHEAGSPVNYAAVEDRLENQERFLLTAAVFADEVSEDAYSLEQARACLLTLEATARQAAKASLRERIRSAEQGGDLALALQLAGELGRLERP
jgi:DNA primase